MGFLQVAAYTAVVGMSVAHAGTARLRVPRVRAWRVGLARVLVAAWSAVRPLLLFVGSMACFVAAAFLVSAVLGWVVAGLVLLVAEWRVTG